MELRPPKNYTLTTAASSHRPQPDDEPATRDSS